MSALIGSNCRGSRGTFIPDPAWPSIVELARQLWGEPNKRLSKPDDVRFGTNGSKSVKPSTYTWHDHEAEKGGGYVELHRMARGPLPPPKSKQGKLKPKPQPEPEHGGGIPPRWQDIAITYDYTDATGSLILQVVRTLTGEPRFRQRRPDGNGKWIWSTKEIPEDDRPLYRLPGLRASDGATVWVCEGEKDADNLHNEGLIATTNVGGAGKWRTVYAQEFRGKPVVILPDHDKAGRDHGEMVARSLMGKAASIKVLALPGLGEKEDVSDWLDRGGTIEELEQLANEAPVYRPPPCPADPFTLFADIKPAIDTADFVEDLLTTSSFVVVYGEPGSRKTFWVLDLCLHVASGRQWSGREVDHGAVLYCALEGGNGILNRVAAARHRLGLPSDTAFALLRTPLDLRSPDGDTEKLTEIISQVAERAGLPVRLVVIDTLARALGGGNENGPEDMGALIGNADRIRYDTGACVLFIHHTGKDATKGSRGHFVAEGGNRYRDRGCIQRGWRIVNVNRDPATRSGHQRKLQVLARCHRAWH
jgi:hypothetical protein